MAGEGFTEEQQTARLEAIAIARALAHDAWDDLDSFTPDDAESMPAGVRMQIFGLFGLVRDLLRLFPDPDAVLDALTTLLIASPTRDDR